MLRTMKVLLLAGALGGFAASPTLAQNARGGGGGGGPQMSAGGSHGIGGGGGGQVYYPRMAGPSQMSMGGGGRMYRSDMGGNRPYMRWGGESPRMRGLAQPNGEFPRERFHRGDRFDRFGDNRRFDRFDRRHARFDDNGHFHKRFRFRNGAFIFFNNGWWYDEPWWTYDTAYYAGGGYGDAHVQWCIDHYRSYNPANNTFVSYGGDILECVSPYGP